MAYSGQKLDLRIGVELRAGEIAHEQLTSVSTQLTQLLDSLVAQYGATRQCLELFLTQAHAWYRQNPDLFTGAVVSDLLAAVWCGPAVLAEFSILKGKMRECYI